MVGEKYKSVDGKFALFFISVILVTVLLTYVHINYIPYSFDDSYIHFRIAKHFVESGQPYFNLGEPVLASSSSAWTLMLSFLFLLFGPSQIPVAIANAIFCVLGSVIFLHLFRKKHTGRDNTMFFWLVPVVYICAVFPASLGLMETAVTMMMFGATILLMEQKNSFAPILLGMLPFFRIEMGIFTFLAVIYLTLKMEFCIQRTGFLLFLGAAPFLLFELIYYGSIIPNSVLAKSHGYDPGIINILITLIIHLLPPPQYGIYISPKLFFLVQMCLIYLLVTMLIILMRKRKPRSVNIDLVLIIDGVLVIGFYIVGQSLIFPWYPPLFLVPLFMGIMLFIAREGVIAKLIFSLFFFPLFLTTVLSSYGLVTDNFITVRYFNENARVAKYLLIGNELFRQYPNAVLATSEIGGLGWGFKGSIADGFGLASPQAIQYQDKKKNGGVGTIASDYIREIQPEIIVSLDIFDQAVSQSDYIKNYLHFIEPIYLLEDEHKLESNTLWGASHLNVFIRKDVWNE